MEAWQESLKAYTGQWAFVLNLSRRMVYFLTLIRDKKYYSSWDERDKCGMRMHFVSSCGSLRERGLIEKVVVMRDYGRGPTETIDYKLTPAGIVVCKLLVMAELMPARRGRKNANSQNVAG